MDSLMCLLQAAAAGDQAAFDQAVSGDLAMLQRRAQHLMSGQLRALVTPADLVQGAMLDAYRFVANGGKVADNSAAAWLNRVLENAVDTASRRYLMTQKRAASLLSLDQPTTATPSDAGAPLVNQLADTGTSPSAGAARNLLAADLPDLLARLPADRRQVLVLMFFEGRPKEEAARIMGRTEEATRKLLGRALDELAVLIAARGAQ